MKMKLDVRNARYKRLSPREDGGLKDAQKETGNEETSKVFGSSGADRGNAPGGKVEHDPPLDGEHDERIGGERLGEELGQAGVSFVSTYCTH